jgi:hypothetical protein
MAPSKTGTFTFDYVRSIDRQIINGNETQVRACVHAKFILWFTIPRPLDDSAAGLDL